MPTLKLTRNQFASFLKDAEQIKQFEQLFKVANGSVTVDTSTLDDGDYIYWDAGQQAWVTAQPDALTKVDDTNVTMTLGGVPGYALFNPVSMTLGWTGQLSVPRGGSGAASLTGYLIGNGVNPFTASATIPGADITGAAITKADDTNVTLTLGGTPASALLRATSFTLGWTGQLSVPRGGTGAPSLTGYVKGNGTSPMTASATIPAADISTGFTTGSVVFAGVGGALSQDNANLFFDDTNNRLGVGTTSPQSTLHVDNGFITTGRYAAGGAVILRSAGGSAGSPSAIGASTSVGSVFFRGYDGTTYREVVNIAGFSDGAVSASSSPGFLQFSTTPTGTTAIVERLRITSGGVVHPGADNTQSLGQSANRWSVVYAGTGTINTSDAREKDWRGTLNDAELSAAREIASNIGVYQWKEAVTQKGADGARLHVGVIAQMVRDIMIAHGLDPEKYGLFCYDEWDEHTEITQTESGESVTTTPAGNRYGVRHDELAMFIAAAQHQRQEELDARIIALEALCIP